MGKRVAMILSGCGAKDGSDAREVVLLGLSFERAGGSLIYAAPESVLGESARLVSGPVRPLAGLDPGEFDMLAIPGGQGVGTALSSYAEKAERCDVDPDVVRLLKGALAKHRPIGLAGLANVLGARVLGPVAGVHLTTGARGTPVAKHAAVMGADVRPGQATDVFIDRKNRVVSTPASLVDDIRLGALAHVLERLARTLMQLLHGGEAAAGPNSPRPARPPRPPAARGPAPSPSPARPSPPTPSTQSTGAVLRRPGSGQRPTRGPGSV